MIQFLLWGMSKILIIVFVLSGPAMITFLLIALLIPWGSANVAFRFPGKKADFLTLKVPTIHELLRSHRSHQGKLPTQPGNHSDITLYPKSSTIHWFATSHQRHSQSKQPLVCWIPVTSDTKGCFHWYHPTAVPISAGPRSAVYDNARRCSDCAQMRTLDPPSLALLRSG